MLRWSSLSGTRVLRCLCCAEGVQLPTIAYSDNKVRTAARLGNAMQCDAYMRRWRTGARTAPAVHPLRATAGRACACQPAMLRMDATCLVASRSALHLVCNTAERFAFPSRRYAFLRACCLAAVRRAARDEDARVCRAAAAAQRRDKTAQRSAPAQRHASAGPAPHCCSTGCMA